jgi:hypothetical protein
MFPSKRQAHAWARGLGWFSLALGAAELLAARPLARGTGLAGRQTLLRSDGVRGAATSAGLLKARDPEPWMWLRVAGDALDLATLWPTAGRLGARTGNTAALVAVVGVTVVDLLCARSLAASRLQAGNTQHRKNYSQRSGWPLPAEEMRGAALVDFKAPADMRTPPALRPWNDGGKPSPAQAAPELRSPVSA